MTLNFKKRCVSDGFVEGMPCQIIRYGTSANESNAGLNYQKWRDVNAGYDELSEHARLPEKQRHFFSERMNDYAEETRAAPVQTDRYALGLRTFEQGRGFSGAERIETRQGSLGRNHQSRKGQ